MTWFLLYLYDYCIYDMKITLLTVGKTDKDWVRQGIDIYTTRMKHYFPFAITEIPELKNASSLSEDQIKTKEGELILKNIKPTEDVILLDERGREFAWELIRRRDLIRFDKFKDVEFVTAKDSYRNWFPIPYAVLQKSLKDENGNSIWTQNAGYVGSSGL